MRTLLRSLTAAAFGAAALTVVAAAPAPAAAQEYSLDKTHADIVFWVDHLGYSKTWGRFNAMDATLTLDQETPANSSVAIVIQAAAIDTNLKKRDEHLRSPDFLNVEEYPTITFTSTEVTPTGEMTADVTGDFTMLGVTKEITIPITINKLAQHPMQTSKEVVGLSGEITIDRTEYGMEYGAGPIGAEIPIFIELEFERPISQ
ncbi:MAG: YceI family protein [Marivibrio sp.]|uniref:YceI family protein n=1 Tax=Marivibrio sp. TaxID=2039719 RepID=UPI0032ED116D